MKSLNTSAANTSKGEWQRFDLHATSGNDNSFACTTIEYAGTSDTYGAMWVDNGATVTLDNVTFSENGACDIDDNGTVNTTATDFVSCNE